MLSWKSHTTLVNTLDSYFYRGLNKLADQKVIFFQEISAQDSRIAREYGFDAIGSPNNIGIGSAYKQLVDYTASDLFLFLENDWLLIEDPYHPIKESMDLLTITEKWADWDFTGNVDVVKLRHRNNPGAPLWSRQFAGKERLHPNFMLDALHWREDETMVDLEPEIKPNGNWFMTTSQFANWTNNPTMFRTEWLRQNILPRLVGDIERAIQPWWQEQTFRVAQGNGLFTHLRLDR